MTSYRTLLLDLDDTLYPSASGLWQAIGDRILAFMTERLGIPADKADVLRAEYLHSYGTTLNGLRIHFQVDPYEYLTFVHEIPIDDFLQPDPKLRAMLANLTQKRVVFTNSSHYHAERVILRLGIVNEIDQVIDIIALDFTNKPEPEAYRKALSLAGEQNPTACIIVEDRFVNLIPAKSLGMTTVLIGDGQKHPQVDFYINRISELTSVVPNLNDGPPSSEVG